MRRAQWNSSLFACLGRNDEFCSSDLEVCEFLLMDFISLIFLFLFFFWHSSAEKGKLYEFDALNFDGYLQFRLYLDVCEFEMKVFNW